MALVTSPVVARAPADLGISFHESQSIAQLWDRPDFFRLRPMAKLEEGLYPRNSVPSQRDLSKPRMAVGLPDTDHVRTVLSLLGEYLASRGVRVRIASTVNTGRGIYRGFEGTVRQFNFKFGKSEDLDRTLEVLHDPMVFDALIHRGASEQNLSWILESLSSLLKVIPGASPGDRNAPAY